jgi:hypothetical protein
MKGRLRSLRRGSEGLRREKESQRAHCAGPDLRNEMHDMAL